LKEKYIENRRPPFPYPHAGIQPVINILYAYFDMNVKFFNSLCRKRTKIPKIVRAKIDKRVPNLRGCFCAIFFEALNRGKTRPKTENPRRLTTKNSV
jgi:hypothetical protein